MGKATFRIYGRFDGASSATVTIDRSSGIVSVRPYKRRKAYTMMLEAVANNIILWRIKQEIFAKKKAKAEARKARRVA